MSSNGGVVFQHRYKADFDGLGFRNYKESNNKETFPALLSFINETIKPV